jgi:hypothetical protein
MVFGERHRVAHFVGVDLVAYTAIEADRGVAPLGSRCSRHDRLPGIAPVTDVPRHCPRRREYFVNRLWSRVGVRTTSVGLLVLGVIGGVYLGQGREVQHRSAEAQQAVVQVADEDDIQLLKERQGAHAAARAWQREAEGDAAAKAAVEAKAAAGKARSLEKKAIAKEQAKKDAEAAKKAASSSGSDSGKSVPFTGPIPESCNEYSGTRAVGCTLMLAAGFGIDQFPCLDKLWKKESGWNPKASNPSSGAYGIPQALPGNKMASEGSDWRNNAATQIKWGLGYIEGRYNTPCGAWSHSQDTGWY